MDTIRAGETDVRFLLHDFVAEVESQSLPIHGIAVRQHDRLIARHHFWNIYRDNVYSCSKSVVSLACGIAFGEGLFSLDDRVVDLLPDHAPKTVSENLSALTVRHLLTMSAGFQKDPLPNRHSDRVEEDWATHILSQPVVEAPGTSFAYMNAPTYLVARIIQEKTGETLVNWLKPRFFNPLHIYNPQWFTCPKGFTSGYTGLFLTEEEMAAVGQLVLSGGRFEGRELVPEWYVREATSKQIDNKNNRLSPGKDGTSGYGYFFWIPTDANACYASGVYGQEIFCFRDLDAVVSVTAHAECDDPNQLIIDLVRKTVVEKLR